MLKAISPSKAEINGLKNTLANEANIEETIEGLCEIFASMPQFSMVTLERDYERVTPSNCLIRFSKNEVESGGLDPMLKLEKKVDFLTRDEHLCLMELIYHWFYKFELVSSMEPSFWLNCSLNYGKINSLGAMFFFDQFNFQTPAEMMPPLDGLLKNCRSIDFSYHSKNIKNCLTNLFFPVNLHYVGFGLNNGHYSLKIALGPFEENNMVSYLKKVNWKGNFDLLNNVIERYIWDAGKIVIVLEIDGKGLKEKLEMEVLYEEEERRLGFLARLLEENHQREVDWAEYFKESNFSGRNYDLLVDLFKKPKQKGYKLILNAQKLSVASCFGS